MIGISWQWVFLDTPRERAEQSWRFWSGITRSPISRRRGPEGEFATLRPRRGDPWIKVQAVGSGPGGVHLDFDVDDVAASANEAVHLGAQRIGAIGDSVVTLRSPGGFVFCLTAAGRPGEESGGDQVRADEADLLDQVCLDLPAPWHRREPEFWSALTGWPYRDSDVAEFGYLSRPAQMPVRLLFQRLGESGGPVRGHVDLACVDRAGTCATHLAAGAEVIAEHDFWTVLRDPVGRTYCLTDRRPDQTWVTRPEADTSAG